MPLYLCRWPNGDCSLVLADSKGRAIELLDEIGNAEGCPITPIRDFMAHFHLTDTGMLDLEGLGEATEDDIFETAYPILYQALLRAPREKESCILTDEGRAVVGAAVARERARVVPKRVRNPRTLLAREIRKRSNMPTRFVERMLRQIAKEGLEGFKGEGKPQ